LIPSPEARATTGSTVTKVMISSMATSAMIASSVASAVIALPSRAAMIESRISMPLKATRC
jgi:hypothetical protein